MTSLVNPPDASAPLGAQGVVAVGHAGHVLLLEAATGRVIWERSLAGMGGATACTGQPVSVAMAGGLVLAGCMGHVFALAIADGLLEWQVDCRGRGVGETSLSVPNPKFAHTLRQSHLRTSGSGH